MFIDRFINFFLTNLFGVMPDGDRKVWFHSQNLNENKKGEARFPPYHGRWWLHFGKQEIHFSWNLWTHFCGIGLSFDPSEDGWKLHIAFPPISFWFSTSLLSRGLEKFLASEKVDKWNQKYGGHQGSARYTEFAIFDLRIFSWAFWWDFCKFDWGWSSKMPGWMHGCFHFDDFFLGKVKYTNENVAPPTVVTVPMPEGDYLARMTLEKATWRRPRWPFPKVMIGYKIDIPRGIPHQGKGENAWDCGEDGLFGCYSEGESVRDAIVKVQELVLKDRKRYDGNMMARYPDPKTRPLDNSDLNALLKEAGQGPNKEA